MPSDDPKPQNERLAVVAFGAIIVVALVLFLVLGRHRWFFADEWDFIALRHASSLDDLFRPHNEHWSTLPIVIYRTLYSLFGLRTYVPYQLTSILLHLTAAALLFVVMLRSRVNPWIATAAASLFALFGAGSEDIVWAFQMAWSASLVLGLTHLILADHDGPIDRRDWLALAAGLLGLMCSGVAVPMTIAVGVAVLIRRGWHLALFHTVPLGAIYVVWWMTNARGSYDGAVSDLARWSWNAVEGTFDGLGQIPGVGIALGIVLVVGLIVAWRDTGAAVLRRKAAVATGLLVGAVAFVVITGIGRASVLGPTYASSGRYLHLYAALTLPALAVAADALARRWRAAVPIVAALLLIGIPGNIEALSDYPASDRVVPGFFFVRQSIVQSQRHGVRSSCETIHGPVVRPLEVGDVLMIRGGPVRLNDRKRGGHVLGISADYTVYDPDDGNTLRAVKPIQLFVSPDDPESPVTVCSVETLDGQT
jgi:hypothetical protein